MDACVVRKANPKLKTRQSNRTLVLRFYYRINSAAPSAKLFSLLLFLFTLILSTQLFYSILNNKTNNRPAQNSTVYVHCIDMHLRALHRHASTCIASTCIYMHCIDMHLHALHRHAFTCINCCRST